MIKIAITGGIGSGKSTVCKLFNGLGVDSFDTDTVAKNQYLKADIKEQVLKVLEDRNALTEGEIDPKIISKLCLEDDTLLNTLTQIVSNGLFIEYDTFLKESKSPYTLFESAILLNSDKYKLFNIIIGVISNKDLRIKRVMKRSSLSEEEINRRINNQVSDEYLTSKCKYFIINNGSLDDLKEQVLDIHSRILLDIKE